MPDALLQAPSAPTVTYAPAGSTLKAFHEGMAFVRSIMGPIGSGKSTACVMELLRRASMQQPAADGVRRVRFAIIRNTYGELKTTTLNTWRQWCPTEMGDFNQAGPIVHRVRSEGLDLEVLFLALDREEDQRKLLSLELTAAWINEAREVPKGILDTLTGRVGRYPPQRDGGATWAGILLDTNPCDVEHWLYRLAEVEKLADWAFFRQPGGVVRDSDVWVPNPDAENLANLPAGYYAKALAGKDDDWIRVYLAGEYGFVREGKPVFDTYRDSVHCGSVEAVPKLPLLLGVDFGLTPAAVIAQRLPDGRWLVLDELVTEDCGVIRFAERLAAYLSQTYPGHHIEGWGDPAGMARSQTDERTALELMREYTGFPWRPAPSNDPTMRLEAVRATLGRLVDGRPGMLISQRCPVLRKGFAGGYCFKRGAYYGGFSDRPAKNQYSHVHDALQYVLLGGGEHLAVRRRADRVRGPRFSDDGEYYFPPDRNALCGTYSADTGFSVWGKSE